VMGEQTKADVVSMRLADGDKLTIEGLALDVIYTPGHTDDSYSFVLPDRVFTGDTLLIRGTGRTDFQNGDPRQQYDSIFNRLLKLPDAMMVYPAHDYKGDTVSTIGEERRFNPRLQVASVDEYAELMGKLNLPHPKMMDVAAPANMHIGLHQDEIARKGWALSADEALRRLGHPDTAFVDLREKHEREKHGAIPGSLHAPYAALQENIAQGGILHELAEATGKNILFYCAYGERSAMAVEAAREAGIVTARHIPWSKDRLGDAPDTTRLAGTAWRESAPALVAQGRGNAARPRFQFRIAPVRTIVPTCSPRSAAVSRPGTRPFTTCTFGMWRAVAMTSSIARSKGNEPSDFARSV